MMDQANKPYNADLYGITSERIAPRLIEYYGWEDHNLNPVLPFVYAKQTTYSKS